MGVAEVFKRCAIHQTTLVSVWKCFRINVGIPARVELPGVCKLTVRGERVL